MSRGPVVRGPELLMRSGVSAGVCTTPWEPWRGGPHLDWRRPPSRGDVPWDICKECSMDRLAE